MWTVKDSHISMVMFPHDFKYVKTIKDVAYKNGDFNETCE